MQTKHLSLVLMSLLYTFPICAMDITLGSADIEAGTGLRAALNAINSTPDTTNSILIPFPLLTNQQYNLPPIEITNAKSLTIRSQIGGTTLDGLNNFPTFGPFRGFFVSSGNVTLQNMHLRNTQAIGGNGGSGARNGTGNGGSGGGGGMGAGGALFVQSGTTVTLNSLAINSALAQGGIGGSVTEGINGAGAGGGGGMGGHGGSHLISAGRVSGGGGGGLFGSGANSSAFGGAGGGGLFGNGGMGTTDMTVGAGGGGGGRALPPGGNGEDAPNATTGGNGNGSNGGIGGLNMKGMSNPSENGQNGGSDTGGGGGGISLGQCGSGGVGGDNGGGGGGAGGSMTLPNLAGPGGKGGLYGGGGSAGVVSSGIPAVASGIGGFGGGGGGASSNTEDTPGAAGGFGGGAGGSLKTTHGGIFDLGTPGVIGGFGGGGSGGVWGPAAGGLSTAFGGSGGRANGTLTTGTGVGGGGGGAGLGGAIFIYDGGTLVIQDNVLFTNNNVSGGAGGSGAGIGLPGSAGQTFGTDLFMMSGSQLTFAVNGNLTIGSDIVGNNGLGGGNTSVNGVTKLGTGTVSLNGVNTYTANTTVSQGTLVINGTTGLATNNTTVNSGGTLRGIGTIHGSTTVQNGGILSPGNSIGTLHLVGPLTIQSGGRLTIEANDTGASSLLDITGSATLNGILHMDFATGTYSQGQLFTVLNATEGVSGTFSKVEANLATLTLQAIYNPNSVQVFIQSFPPILSLSGITGNAKTVGNYLNSINTEPFLQQELIALAELPSDELAKALQSISPGSKSFSTYISQNTMFTVNKVATTRMSIKRSQNVMGHQNPKMASLFQESISQDEGLLADKGENTLPRGSTTRAAASRGEYAVWASGLGDFMHQKAEKQNPAFHATSPGGLVGVETYRFSSVLLGAAAGYAHSDMTMNQQAGHSDIDYYVVGMYETTYMNNGYIELCLWGTYNQFHNERHIVYPGFDKTAHSTHHGWQITPSVSAGYDFGVRWGVLEPFASVDVVVNFEQKFAEKKASPFNMEYPRNTSELLRFEAGLNAYEIWERCWGSCIVRETLSYVLRKPYHVGTVNAAIVGAPGSFTVYSFTDQQNILSPGIEIFCKHKKGAFFSLAYDGEFGFGSGYMSNELIGKVGIYF